VQDDRNLAAAVTLRLLNPPIGIARLHPLDLQVDVLQVRNHIWAVCPASELLAAPGLDAHDG
jgi:hypothetical protein